MKRTPKSNEIKKSALPTYNESTNVFASPQGIRTTPTVENLHITPRESAIPVSQILKNMSDRHNHSRSTSLECAYPRKQQQHVRFATPPKQFPNNYSSLTPNPEYMTVPRPLYMGIPNGCADSSHANPPPDYTKCSSSDMRLAGMKIFATIMLNAWRRRRDDVQRLLVKVEELKKSAMKARNQIHVYNTLFRVEQKRNDELSCQLKRSLESIIHAKSSCEGLTTSVISLKADKALLEQELQSKYNELEATNELLTQTKNELFRSMMDQSHLRTALLKEQRHVQSLENHRNKLINELYQLGNENRTVEQKYRCELNKKDKELNQTQTKLEHMEEILKELRCKANTVDECHANDEKLRRQIRQLETQLSDLQISLSNSLGSQLSVYWGKTRSFQEKTVRWMHWLAYMLLPAVPSPHVLLPKISLFHYP